MSIPKTIIVGLNLHGEIPLNCDGFPSTKQLENDYVIKIDAVAPGVPNISTVKNYNETSNHIKTIVESHEPDLTIKQLRQFANKIQNKLIVEHEKNMKDIEKEYYENKIPQFQSFFHNKDKAFIKTEFITGDIITNKLFYKFTPTEMEQVEDSTFFNKIILYNMDEINFFELLANLGYNTDEITLFQLLDFLQGAGATKILLVDLSCSVFTQENKTAVSARQTRYLRRTMKKNLKSSF